MVVGILSDTHGRVDAAALAIELLAERGAGYLIHCGDIGDGVIELLAGHRAAFVFGNNDMNRAEYRRLSTQLGVECLGDFGTLTLEGKSIAVTHGDQAHILSPLLKVPRYDYLLTGHTHLPHDRRAGTMRCINPGALHRATPRTVSTLDLRTGALEGFIVNV